MIKVSLFVMMALTVAFAFGLRWREQRIAAQRPSAAARPGGWIAAKKRVANRWVTAAALAAVTTLLALGGLNWLRVWTG